MQRGASAGRYGGTNKARRPRPPHVHEDEAAVALGQVRVVRVEHLPHPLDPRGANGVPAQGQAHHLEVGDDGVQQLRAPGASAVSRTSERQQCGSGVPGTLAATHLGDGSVRQRVAAEIQEVQPPGAGPVGGSIGDPMGEPRVPQGYFLCKLCNKIAFL